MVSTDALTSHFSVAKDDDFFMFTKNSFLMSEYVNLVPKTFAYTFTAQAKREENVLGAWVSAVLKLANKMLLSLHRRTFLLFLRESLMNKQKLGGRRRSDSKSCLFVFLDVRKRAAVFGRSMEVEGGSIRSTTNITCQQGVISVTQISQSPGNSCSNEILLWEMQGAINYKKQFAETDSFKSKCLLNETGSLRIHYECVKVKNGKFFS